MTYFIVPVPRQYTKLENWNIFVEKYYIFNFYPQYVLNHKLDFEFFYVFFLKTTIKPTF